MDTKILKDLGLEEKEIKVYLSLLRAGNVTASKISKETNIDRATCYRYLDSLISKGLVSYAIHNNIKYFQSAHPKKILQDLKEKEREYKKVLPELVKIANLSKEETNVEVYKGLSGLKTVLKDILKEKEDHFVFGEEGHFQDLMPIFFEQFIEECKRNKIKEDILCSESVLNKVKKYDYKYSRIRTIPNKEIFPTTTLIYNGRIVIFNWELPHHAIVISNKNMAQAYKAYFNILWKQAKP